MKELGEMFPPRSVDEVLMYKDDDVVAGYRSYRPDAEMPANATAGFKWGWTNSKRDKTGENDQFIGLRRQLIQFTKRPN